MRHFRESQAPETDDPLVVVAEDARPSFQNLIDPHLFEGCAASDLRVFDRPPFSQGAVEGEGGLLFRLIQSRHGV